MWQSSAVLLRSHRSRAQADEFNAAIERHLGAAPLSMAQLQGYLILHKDDGAAAITNVGDLRARQERAAPVPSPGEQAAGKRAARPAPVRMLSAADVDKMFYNPQSDADELLSKMELDKGGRS